MPETLEIDVEQLMERIRHTIGMRRPEVLPPDAGAPSSEGNMPPDLSFLQSGYDIQHVYFTSHRKVIGRFIVFAKNALRQLMTPLLERQVAFNSANAHVAFNLWEQAERTRQQHAVALQTVRTEITEQQALALQTVRTGITEQQALALQTVRTEITEQQALALQTVRTEIMAQVEAMQQQQTAALQTVRTEIMAQVEAMQQQQTEALQTMRTEITERVQAWRRLMERRFGDLEQRASRLRDRVLTETDWRLAEWEKALGRLKTDHILQERRVTLLLEEARKRLPEPLSHGQLQTFTDEAKHMLEALYVSFEDQFRGTREDIKNRLQVYLPILERANLGSDKMPVLDVGCGRGEWLELLKDKALHGQGVDLNRLLVEECQSWGLEAVEGEAISYLSSLPSNSLGAVTGFHLVEHLPFDMLVKLLDETVRVLKPGGAAIFETPNPANVLVSSHTFYFDPTHRNPLPSATVKFIAEARGLCRVEVMDLHPYPESYRVKDEGIDIVKRFNEYFYGPQDYAMVGWKV